jgi:hypothetical protein
MDQSALLHWLAAAPSCAAVWCRLWSVEIIIVLHPVVALLVALQACSSSKPVSHIAGCFQLVMLCCLIGRYVIKRHFTSMERQGAKGRSKCSSCNSNCCVSSVRVCGGCADVGRWFSAAHICQRQLLCCSCHIAVAVVPGRLLPCGSDMDLQDSCACSQQLINSY